MKREEEAAVEGGGKGEVKGEEERGREGNQGEGVEGAIWRKKEEGTVKSQ